MAKNYYVILGINSDATQDQIKSAYREQVKHLHPDYYGEDSKPFRELQEAYAILSEPTRRRAYDRQVQAETSTPIKITRVNRNFADSSPIQPVESIKRHRPIEEVFPNPRSWFEFFF